ncbi:MAG: transcription factor [Ancylobacter novellus]|uniref:Transcription factor n=1 Tax=Ancylobacter novellus TaxID=921 RepID=A0A2W5LX18_ANCNO|nr:MAG: transcription factor [Ancylobacter novellus]
MPRQLNVRSDRAYETANRLARRLGASTTEVVVRALEDLDRKSFRAPTYDELTDEQKRDVDRILAMAEEVRRSLPPGVTSDHSDMYDDNGLPK